MGITEFIQNLFAPSRPPMTPREKTEKGLKQLEIKKAEAQLKLVREREKPSPDVLKVDRLEREIKMWDQMIVKIRADMKDI